MHGNISQFIAQTRPPWGSYSRRTWSKSDGIERAKFGNKTTMRHNRECRGSLRAGRGLVVFSLPTRCCWQGLAVSISKNQCVTPWRQLGGEGWGGWRTVNELLHSWIKKREAFFKISFEVPRPTLFSKSTYQEFYTISSSGLLKRKTS